MNPRWGRERWAGSRAFVVLSFLLLYLTLCSVARAAPVSGGSPPGATSPNLPITSGTGTAVEGDVVSVNGNAVKLWGIDAPDRGQTCQSAQGRTYDCFEASRKMLETYVGSQSLDCYIRGKDSHGQQIGTCGIGGPSGLDLAALMVRDGWALSFHGLSLHYAELEAKAQAKRRGLWAGRVEAPWSWRSTQFSRTGK